MYATNLSTMESNPKQKILNRLKSARGHLDKVLSMAEEDRYCIDILQQLSAVQSALNKTSELLLERHLNSCVSQAVRSDDPERREKVLSELLLIYKKNA